VHLATTNSGLATIFLRVSAQIPNLTYKKTAQGRGTLPVSGGQIPLTKNYMLTRFWIEFNADGDKIPIGLSYGCGVTAYDFSDALKIIQTKIFKGQNLPDIRIKKENIDIQTLDQNHVVPNMYSPDKRGIWFPIGFHDNH
jgi:hypothetical protein